MFPQHERVDLDPKASFLVAGGLGGIGRSTAQWLLEKGAKHILLLSRNAESHSDCAALVQEGKMQSCNIVAHNCDITDELRLRELLISCQKTMPPVRGVINGAMVLNVSAILGEQEMDLRFADNP